MEEISISEKRFKEYQQELLAQLKDSIHLKLVSAYEHPNPVEIMEKKLGEILIEVLSHED